MTHPGITLALRKLAEKRPDRLGAVDVAILRSEERGRDAWKARIRRVAGHAMAAAVDAIEHGIASRRAVPRDQRHRALVRTIAAVHVRRAGILRLAAIDAAPERQRLFSRPKSFHREAAGALAALIGDQGSDRAAHDQHRHPARRAAGAGPFGGEGDAAD